MVNLKLALFLAVMALLIGQASAASNTNISQSGYYAIFNNTWGGIDYLSDPSRTIIYADATNYSLRQYLVGVYNNDTLKLSITPTVTSGITIVEEVNNSNVLSINVTNTTYGQSIIYNFTDNNIKATVKSPNNVYRLYVYFGVDYKQLIDQNSNTTSTTSWVDNDAPNGKLIVRNNVTMSAISMRWTATTDYDASISTTVGSNFSAIGIARDQGIPAGTVTDIFILPIHDIISNTPNIERVVNYSWLTDNSSYYNQYQFNSTFEGGNGNETTAEQISSNSFKYAIEDDPGVLTALNNYLWFYNTVIPESSGLLTINITGFQQNAGTLVYPVISTNNIDWNHIPIANQTSGGSGYNYWKRFNLSVSAGIKYYFAMHEPYLVSSNLNVFNTTMSGNPKVRITTVATSEQGRPILMYNISNASSPNANNYKFLFISGQHAALESTGAFATEGMINYLLNSTAINDATFYFILIANPDGVIAGNSRNNMNATTPRELNRNWFAPNQSETIGITSFINLSRPFIYMGDIHSWQADLINYRYSSTTGNATPYLNILSQFEGFIPYDKLQNGTLDTANTFHVEMQNNSKYTNISTTTEFKFNYNWNRDDWANDSDQRQQGEYEIRAILNAIDISPPLVNSTIQFVSPTPDNNSVNTSGVVVINTSTFCDTSYCSAWLNWNNSVVLDMRFNNGSGTLIEDSSSYKNNGTADNGYAWNASGKFGYAIDATSSTLSNITIPYSSSLQPDYITITGWLYPISGRYIFGNMNSTGVNGSYLVQLDSSAMFQFIIRNETHQQNSASINITKNTWTHFAITFDGDTIGVYFNGTLMTRTDVVNQTIRKTTLYPFMFFNRMTANDRDFNGTLDDFRIYNRVLSSDEINASYNNSKYSLNTTISGLSDGEYNYTAYVQDSAGLVNQTEKRYVTVQLATTSIITVPANSWVLFNNWTIPETFTQIAQNESNDIAYSFYNVSTGEWDSYFSGYSWNANNIIDKNNSVMGYFDAPTTITAQTVTPSNTTITTGWNMLYVEGTSNRTISEIKANMGANVDDVYRYNMTTGAYSNTLLESSQANEGFLAYANTNFTWIRSTI